MPRSNRNVTAPTNPAFFAHGIRFIDLFCGIGGFRFAVESAAKRAGLSARCVFSSDINECCQQAYSANFWESPVGDITQVTAEAVPDHDLLLAGFPCQPFSIIGKMRGFEDTRGTLFFDIARILEAKRPAAFVLEKVKLLAGHNQGRTLTRILETLHDLITPRAVSLLHFARMIKNFLKKETKNEEKSVMQKRSHFHTERIC